MKAEIGQNVGSCGVGKMIQQILEGALASHNALNEKSQNCNHSESAILNLLKLEGLHRRLVLAKFEDVEEGPSWVGGVTRASEHFLQAQQGRLASISGLYTATTLST